MARRLIFLAVMCLGVAIDARAASVHLRMQQLCSDKTTENGADEVYIMVYARRSDGATYLQRWPSNAPGESSGHWDMNDGDQPTDNPDGDSHCITNKTLFSEDIEPGQSWQVTVILAEEDGGTSADLQNTVGELASAVPDPFVSGAGAVLVALSELGLKIEDSDDYIGSFSVRISAGDDGLSTEWNAGDRIAEDSTDGAAKVYRMGGDGSNYIGWYRAD